MKKMTVTVDRSWSFCSLVVRSLVVGSLPSRPSSVARDVTADPRSGEMTRRKTSAVIRQGGNMVYPERGWTATDDGVILQDDGHNNITSFVGRRQYDSKHHHLTSLQLLTTLPFKCSIETLPRVVSSDSHYLKFSNASWPCGSFHDRSQLHHITSSGSGDSQPRETHYSSPQKLQLHVDFSISP